MKDRRPDPEELLKTIQAEDKRAAKGRLHVFFGMCPGVGKTFAMLKAAHEKKKQGVDVVIGVVETHGRLETENLIQGLEKISKKFHDYKGTVIEEMDLDAILKRKPEIVLVDELAHSNAPGSRHLKRYQDVEELLEAGIHVFTTMNVQHVESRSDLVSQITGIVIRETVPDSFLQKAHQIELLDITPEELLKRLKEGKVYLGERAQQASQNFFKIENLIALRELSLRFTAEKVDHQLRDEMSIKQILGPWNTNERLLVAISHSPYSGRLIRSARRMAFSLEAPWIALYVDSGDTLSEDDQKTLNKNIALAKELGAEIVLTKEADLAEAIKRVCEERNVTQIIMGRPDRRFFRDIIAKGTLLDRLVRETSKIDVHVVRQERKPRYLGFHFSIPKMHTGLASYWYALWFLVIISFGSYAALPWIGYRAVGFVFLLAVVIISFFASRGPIIFAAVISSFAWNFFFIPPLYTFAINEPEDIMMCLAYFVVASVSGYLAHRIRTQEEELRGREFKSRVLYEFGQQIADAKDSRQIAGRAQDAIEKLFDSKIAILLAGNDGLDAQALNYFEDPISEKILAVAQWSFKNAKKAGWSTNTLSSSECLSLPLIGQGKTIGVLLFFPKDMEQLTLDQEIFLDSILRHLAVSLERNLLEKEAQQSLLLKESEKLHQILLNSVSHELKTPITGIVGASSALLESKDQMSQDSKNILLKDLVHSSQRLSRVVENLLDMSRISSGVLQIRKEIFEINDFIQSFLQRNGKFFDSHQIHFTESEKEAYVQGDDRLLEHVLMNIVSNAAAYSKSGSEIEISTVNKETHVEIQIKDQGKGIDEDELKNIFNPFYRAPGTPAGGTGLGLTIAKSIMEAHGGNIMVRNRQSEPGAVFTLVLPTQTLDLGS